MKNYLWSVFCTETSKVWCRRGCSGSSLGNGTDGHSFGCEPLGPVILHQDRRCHTKDEALIPTSKNENLGLLGLLIASFVSVHLLSGLIFYQRDSGLGRFVRGQCNRNEQLPPQGGPLLIKYDFKNKYFMEVGDWTT